MGSHNAADIQGQHHFLAEKVKTVCTNLKFPSGNNDDLKDQLDDLVEFLQSHNEEEEALMKSYRYHGLELHERKHQNLLNRLFSLREQVYVSFEEEHKQALLRFFETELIEHITEDVKLGIFPITTMPGGSE